MYTETETQAVSQVKTRWSDTVTTYSRNQIRLELNSASRNQPLIGCPVSVSTDLVTCWDKNGTFSEY